MRVGRSLLLAAMLASPAYGTYINPEVIPSTNERAKTGEDASANPRALSSTSADAQTARQDSPAALVSDMYRLHKQNRSPFSGGSKNRALYDRFFEKKLADLIWNDLNSGRDGVGVIDFDVLYNTQDPEIKNLSVPAPKVEGQRATVPVSFTNYGAKEVVTFLLVEEGGAWKIFDIRYKDGGGLLKYFAEDAKRNSAYENFAGTYQVGSTTCTVKLVEAAFEVRWAKGSGAMTFYFDGEDSGSYSFSSEDRGQGKDRFVFDNELSDTGRFIRADGREMQVKKVK